MIMCNGIQFFPTRFTGGDGYASDGGGDDGYDGRRGGDDAYVKHGDRLACC